jgi:hemolysin activation/secretion protein
MTFIDAQNLNLVVKGMDSLETAVIDSLNYRKSFNDYASLENELETLQFKIKKLGFIENRLIYNAKNNDSTYLAKIALNKKYYTIYIYYDKKLISEEILRQVSDRVTPEYFVTTISKSESVLNYIISRIIEDGLPFAKLRLTNIKKRDVNNIRADLILSTDSKRRIDEILVKGYEKFPRSFLKHLIRIKKEDAFNLEGIKEKAEIINALSFARQAKTPEVLFTKDSTSLYLYLEKTKSNTFDGFLGFGTNESTNKIEFDGYLNLNLINNLNYGESFVLNYKSEENDQKNFETNLSLPYILGSPVGTELSLNIFKKDSTYTTVNQSVSLFYQINFKHKAFVGINAIQSNNLLENNLSPTILDYNSIIYNLRYQFIERQNFNVLFPINFMFDLKIGLGKRDFEDLTEEQAIINLDAFKIFNLNLKNSIYLRANAAGINSDNYLTNELFRFGGINSIRGFEENSLTASLFGVINTEYRYSLNKSIYVHSVFDAAYFENKISLTKEKLFAFGFGFGIYTKSGLLKFNYANGKSENQKFKFSDSKIHISLSAVF